VRATQGGLRNIESGQKLIFRVTGAFTPIFRRSMAFFLLPRSSLLSLSARIGSTNHAWRSSANFGGISIELNVEFHRVGETAVRPLQVV
jgi:hypothetical protein